jgi:hypothetical protein
VQSIREVSFRLTQLPVLATFLSHRLSRLYFTYARLPTVDEWISLYPFYMLYISPHRQLDQYDNTATARRSWKARDKAEAEIRTTQDRGR